jgi:spore photoproduct lyase
MTQKLQLKVHPEFKRVYGGGIIRWFDKTPSDIVCPHFWELNWAYGCRFECSYCYLQGTFHGNKRPWPRPLDQIFAVLDEFFKDHQNPQILNSGELTDSLVFPRRIKQISDKFEEQSRHRLLLLTKSANVGHLDDKPRKQTIFSFSMNAKEAWRRWEHKTPPPDQRVEAAKVTAEIGDEVRVRIDPIFPVENWRAEYEELIYSILSEFTPERITLGTPRGLAKTLMFSKDLSWTKYFDEGKLTGWGKKISDALRREIYLYFYDKLCALGFDKSKIAMCKETVSMWKELGLDPAKIRCNCVW